MSHVDDGTLHAYLDGELTPVESERLDAHLAACLACRARLEEERALIERASTLLSRAVPQTPERAAPPLHQLRRPRVAWRLRMPLAWAATVLMAVGLGWFLRGPTAVLRSASDSRNAPLSTEPSAEAPPEALALDSRLAPMPTQPAEQRRSNEAEASRMYRADDAATVSSPGAAADRPPAVPAAREEADARRQVAKAADQLAQGSAGAGLRDVAPAPVAGNAIVVTAAPRDAARDTPARQRLSSVWPVIEHQPARDLLGAPPAAIPGVPIRAMRRNPDASEVLVEQDIGNGVLVQLFERRMEAAGEVLQLGGRIANERLARFVGGLRIEIAGPLTADSLSRLLGRVTPTAP
jgi:hypothetical protein